MQHNMHTASHKQHDMHYIERIYGRTHDIRMMSFGHVHSPFGFYGKIYNWPDRQTNTQNCRNIEISLAMMMVYLHVKL